MERYTLWKGYENRCRIGLFDGAWHLRKDWRIHHQYYRYGFLIYDESKELVAKELAVESAYLLSKGYQKKDEFKLSDETTYIFVKGLKIVKLRVQEKHIKDTWEENFEKKLVGFYYEKYAKKY